MAKYVLTAAIVGLLYVGSASAADDRKDSSRRRDAAGQQQTERRESTTRRRTAADDTESTSPEAFVKEAASAGMKEVKLGEIAQQRAQNKEVKEFARHMIADHKKANQELKRVAERKRIQLDTKLARKHEEVINKLSKMRGEQFDQAYAQHMVESHKQAISKFEAQAKNSQDEAIRSFAAKSLPTLKKHLQMAQRLTNDGQSGRSGRSTQPGQPGG